MDMREADRRRVVVVLLAAAVASCVQKPEEEDLSPVSDAAYVQVMTDLMLLDAEPPSGATAAEREAKADSARRDILAGQGVTARDILDFAESYGGEASHMEVLWQQITQRYDSARIASLNRSTEARSEPGGKLGDEARAAATRSSDASVDDSAAAPADSLERPKLPNKELRSRLLKRMEDRRPVRDTTGQQD